VAADEAQRNFVKAETERQALATEKETLSERVASAESKCALLVAELDVSRASQDRASKTISERDDAFKRVRSLVINV
jgi:hypothetical protein